MQVRLCVLSPRPCNCKRMNLNSQPGLAGISTACFPRSLRCLPAGASHEADTPPGINERPLLPSLGKGPSDVSNSSLPSCGQPGHRIILSSSSTLPPLPPKSVHPTLVSRPLGQQEPLGALLKRGDEHPGFVTGLRNLDAVNGQTSWKLARGGQGEGVGLLRPSPRAQITGFKGYASFFLILTPRIAGSGACAITGCRRATPCRSSSSGRACPPA